MLCDCLHCVVIGLGRWVVEWVVDWGVGIRVEGGLDIRVGM